jgi:ABC-type transport system involved in cytochrome bd biosynthesis fused ATPase/permease subunit
LDVSRRRATTGTFNPLKNTSKDCSAGVAALRRVATMATLRIALLSALVLELAATISVALVAVSVGLRLVHGGMTLQTALFLLVLAPEAYLPLRRAAAEYHAAAEGVAAAERAFAVLAAAEPLTATLPSSEAVPDPARASLSLDRVGVRFPDRDLPVLDNLSMVIPPGQVTAIVGPSGSGKSTVLRLLLGLGTPDEGAIRIGDMDLARIDPARWHRRLAWLPQHPRLLSGSIVDNIMLGRPGVPEDAVSAAAARAGITDLLAGERAVGRAAGNGPHVLSAGQRQRVALARVFLRIDAALVLLDEPTAHLDAAAEQRISEALRDFVRGRTVVLVTHRAALLGLADHIVEMRPAGADAPAPPYNSVGAR